jgi:N-methylhydantoinase A
MKNGYRLGVDTGGTFTDLCVLDEATGRLAVAKVPSTPSNPAEAVITGIQKLLEAEGIPPEKLRFLIHGTTVATNALLERKGARTALLTTEGFEDVLHIGRQDRPRLYDFRARRPEPIVPGSRRFGLPERVLHTGEVFKPLDSEKAEETALRIRDTGVQSIAVCLIHAYANPVHEQEVRTILSRLLPDTCVTLSSEVLPEFREYERTSTVCVNAYVMPMVDSYVADLQDRLKTLGTASDLYIMQSNGGVITAETARAMSARTVLSGPAGGALTGALLSRTLDRPDLITIDMGGTSSDICLIEAGTPKVSTECEIGGHPIKLPMIDINTIGAGGGSIARIDGGGALRVGPESAGAVPGPVCYGRGGREPTVTDANAVLGRSNPSSLLDGEMQVHLEEARKALRDRIASPLEMEVEQAAEGIIEVVNANMIRGIRRVSVERGYDPRGFVLVPFGGAGPMHGVALARALSIREVIVPAHPGIASAVGMLSADVRHDYVQTHIRETGNVDSEEILAVFRAMEGQGMEQLGREGFSDDVMVTIRSADMRYPRQAYELPVPMPPGILSAPELDATADRFHDLHEKTYGYARRSEPVEFVNLRVTALGKLPQPPTQGKAGTAVNSGSAPAEPHTFRDVVFNGRTVHTPVYLRDDLLEGQEVDGPAILEQLDSTVVLHPLSSAVRDLTGNLHIRLQEEK